MLKPSQRQGGFSLVELLLANALGLSLLAAIGSTLATGINATADNLKRNRLHHGLTTTLLLIQRELRRAGGLAITDRSTSLAAAETTNALSLHAGCLLYSYDRNTDGALDGEQFGFRHSRHGAIEMRKAGRGCQDGGWEKITDPRTINIVGFDMELVRRTLPLAGGGRYLSRMLRLSIDGALRHDPSIRRTVASSVYLRNDAIVAAATGG